MEVDKTFGMYNEDYETIMKEIAERYPEMNEDYRSLNDDEDLED